MNILKYNPKYNKSLNLKSRYTIRMAIQKIKEEIDQTYNLRKIKKDILKYGIKIDKFNRSETMSSFDFDSLYKACKERA